MINMEVLPSVCLMPTTALLHTVTTKSLKQLSSSYIASKIQPTTLRKCKSVSFILVSKNFISYIQSNYPKWRQERCTFSVLHDYHNIPKNFTAKHAVIYPMKQS
jgi:hypothetical protein